MERAMRRMRHPIATMARQVNNLIVDDVMSDPGEGQEYREFLDPVDHRLARLFAPLDVLEAREGERRDRLIGSARWQCDRVRNGLSYDLEIDTTIASTLERGRKIKSAFTL